MIRKLILCLLVFTTAICAYAEVPELADCEVTATRTGDEADKEIFRLHGKEIDFEDSYVAEYFCKNGSTAIIWASFSKTVKEASALFELMDEKMPASKVFKNRLVVKSGEHNVIYVFGMGMDNYYFVDKKANYWIAARGKDTVEILKKFTQAIK